MSEDTEQRGSAPAAGPHDETVPSPIPPEADSTPPAGDVTTPRRLGNAGNGRLVAASKRPSASSRVRSRRKRS